MKQLHPDVIADINSKALFSKEEETILKKVTSVSKGFRRQTQGEGGLLPIWPVYVYLFGGLIPLFFFSIFSGFIFWPILKDLGIFEDKWSNKTTCPI